MKKGIHPKEYRTVVFKDMSNEIAFMTKSTVATKDTIVWEMSKDKLCCDATRVHVRYCNLSFQKCQLLIIHCSLSIVYSSVSNANPPCAVSLYNEGRSLPVRFMVFTTLSKLIRWLPSLIMA